MPNVVVQAQGAVVVNPSTAGLLQPSAQSLMPISVIESYGGSTQARATINVTDPSSPFVIPMPGLTNARFIYLETSGQSMVLKLTSVNGGTDQEIPVSNVFMIDCPLGGDEFTVIKVIGRGDLSYLIAGDVT